MLSGLPANTTGISAFPFFGTARTSASDVVRALWYLAAHTGQSATEVVLRQFRLAVRIKLNGLEVIGAVRKLERHGLPGQH